MVFAFCVTNSVDERMNVSHGLRMRRTITRLTETRSEQMRAENCCVVAADHAREDRREDEKQGNQAQKFDKSCRTRYETVACIPGKKNFQPKVKK